MIRLTFIDRETGDVVQTCFVSCLLTLHYIDDYCRMTGYDCEIG